MTLQWEDQDGDGGDDVQGRRPLREPDCALEQAVAVVGDWWTLLVLCELACGVHRFDQLHAELGISPKVLTQRLTTLTADEIVERRRYQDRPARFEYHLTDRGRGLLPVLVALQSWGARHLLGDGSLTATTAAESPESARVHSLLGQRIPPLVLPGPDGRPVDPVRQDTAWTVIYCFPGAFAPGDSGNPAGWDAIPGTRGCTLESETYRDHHRAFAAHDATIHGVSAQRPDQLAAFTAHADLPFPLLSDVALELAAALRLPTFYVAGVERLKRLTMLVDRDRVIRELIYPIHDPAESVRAALDALVRLGPPAPGS